MRLWHPGPRLSLCSSSRLYKRSRTSCHSNGGTDVRTILWLHLLLSLSLLCPATAAASYQQTAVDSLHAFRVSVKNPSVLSTWENGDPCSSDWTGVECTDNFTITSLKLSNLKLTGTLSPLLGQLTTLTTLWLDSNSFVGPIPSQLGELRNLTSLRLSNNSFNGSIPESLGMLPNLKELYLSNNDLSGTLPLNLDSTAHGTRLVVNGNNQLCTLVPGYGLQVCGLTLAPAFIFGPVAAIPPPAKGKTHVAAIVGGVAGAVALVVLTTFLVALCLYRARSWAGATSDTGSSDPSAQVDWAKGPEQSLVGGPAVVSGTQAAKVFSLEEIEHATKEFSEDNLIGEGGFGFVYKGLLEDGTIVAVKRRQGIASQDFAIQVEALAQIQHRNLVNVLGLCQENDQQMVLYDYIPNGSVSGHLYDTNGLAVGELDFKQRLSIALGAAKGLEHLHTMTPMLVHRDFKTNNVLLDASLVAKVTDYGLSRLLSDGRQEGSVLASTSSADGTAGFLDPEYYKTQRLTPKSDVFSFGVFLLELISGREAICLRQTRLEWSLVEWGRSLLETGNLGALVDITLGSNYTEAAMRKVVEVGFKCVEKTGERRPTMTEVVADLEDSLQNERGLATGGEGTATVTLGSELFT